MPSSPPPPIATGDNTAIDKISAPEKPVERTTDSPSVTAADVKRIVEDAVAEIIANKPQVVVRSIAPPFNNMVQLVLGFWLATIVAAIIVGVVVGLGAIVLSELAR